MRYYIYSLDYYETTTKALAGYIRGHWHIENERYWHLDVTFREDACRARTAINNTAYLMQLLGF